MSLRTPLSRVLGKGSAKDGTDHWWMQRVTAVGLVLVGAWFLVALARLPSYSYAVVTDWASQPLNGIMLLLLCTTLAWHSQLGVQVVIEDYVHGPAVKVLALILNKFAHVFALVAAAYAVLTMAFGGAA